MLSSLQGRRSIVTGACGHIGRVICHTLAELGSDLILLDLKEQNLNILANEITNKYCVGVDVFACDFEEPRQVKETLAILNQKYTSINILINNAAFVGTSGLDGWSVEFNKQSVDTWRRALEVNLTSVFAIVQGLS